MHETRTLYIFHDLLYENKHLPEDSRKHAAFGAPDILRLRSGKDKCHIKSICHAKGHNASKAIWTDMYIFSVKRVQDLEERRW